MIVHVNVMHARVKW